MIQNPEHNIKVLTASQAFSSLDLQSLEQVAGLMQTIHIRSGEYLLRQGETSDSGLYVVELGQLQAVIPQEDNCEQVVGKIGQGEIIGEVELLTGQARSASIKALSDASLLFLPRDAFEPLAAEVPQILKILGAISRQRMRRNQLFRILPGFFGPLNLEELEIIEAAVEWVHLKSGKTLIRCNEVGCDFFIVVSGRLRASIPDDKGVEITVNEIFAGESVGEMSFFTGEPRTANVIAMRDSDLICITPESFLFLQSKIPQITFQITKHVVTRWRRSVQDRSFTKPAVNIALVPASPDVPLADFTRRLAAALSHYTSCIHINSTTVDQAFHLPGFSQLPENDLNEVRLVTWLDELERTCPLNIYEADLSLSNWTQRSIQRADRVIFVARASDQPDPAYLRELAAYQMQADIRKELALLHDQSTHKISGTRRWLDQLGRVKRHYHLRAQTEADYQRMARLITGKAIGLVLGGGGARGFAHAGVLRAIEELGLQIDLVGGTSMGAIVGALYADGRDSQALYHAAQQFVLGKKIIDYTFPATSFLAAKPLTAALMELFGDRDIEDTWIEFFCVSANLTQARQVIHQRGPLWKYTRASGALPPVFPPVVDGGDLLVDGVLVNNLPVDIMKEICEGGVVIGVDVSSEEKLEGNYDFGPTLSGWQVLWKRLNPFQEKPNIPLLPSLTMRVAEFSSVCLKKEQYQIPELMIRPAVQGIDLFAVDSFEEIVELGYRAAKPALENWLRKGQENQSQRR